MAFPTSPTDGQIYNDYTYNLNKQAWTDKFLYGTTIELTTTTLPSLTYSFEARENKKYGIIFKTYVNGIETGSSVQTINLPSNGTASVYMYVEDNSIVGNFTNGEIVTITATARKSSSSIGSFSSYEDLNAQNFIHIEELDEE